MVKNLKPNQMKKLRDRRLLRPADRANVDYKMAKKLQSGLDGLAGLLYIMKALPSEKLKKGEYIKEVHIRLLLELTEAALRTLDYKKVRGTAEDPYVLEERNKKVVGIDLRSGQAIKHGKLHRVKAKKKEIERAILLWEHVDYLVENFVLPKNNIEHPGMGWRHSVEDSIDMQIRKKEEQNEVESPK